MSRLSSLNSKHFYGRMQLILEISVRFLWLAFCVGIYMFTDTVHAGSTPLWVCVLWIVFVYGLGTLVYLFFRDTFLVLLLHLVVCSVGFALLLAGNALGSSIMYMLLFVMIENAVSNIIAARRFHPPCVYSHRWMYYAVPIAFLFYAIYQSSNIHYVIAFCFGLIFVLGHFWCTYAQGISEFMGGNLYVENVPRADIYRSNTKTVAVILLVFLLISGFVFMFRYMSVFETLGRAMSAPISAAVDKFITVGKFVRRIFTSDGSTGESAGMPEQQVQVAPIPQTVLNVLGIMTGLFLLAFFILWIISLTMRPKKPVKIVNIIDGNGDDEVEDIVPKKKRRRHIFKDNNEKVRYRFKRFIKKNLKPNVPYGKTAEELSRIAARNVHLDVKVLDEADFEDDEVIDYDDTETYNRLTELYNIARYSDRMVTNDEIKTLQ